MRPCVQFSLFGLCHLSDSFYRLVRLNPILFDRRTNWAMLQPVVPTRSAMPESHNRPVGALQLGRQDSDGQQSTGNVIFLSNSRKGVVTTWHRENWMRMGAEQTLLGRLGKDLKFSHRGAPNFTNQGN
jgi:hypothetical protein